MFVVIAAPLAQADPAAAARALLDLRTRFDGDYPLAPDTADSGNVRALTPSPRAALETVLHLARARQWRVGLGIGGGLGRGDDPAADGKGLATLVGVEGRPVDDRHGRGAVELHGRRDALGRGEHGALGDAEADADDGDHEEHDGNDESHGFTPLVPAHDSPFSARPRVTTAGGGR